MKNLVDANLIKSSRVPLKWKQICERFDLLPDNPHKYTYIHIIYSALLVRFVELFLTDNLNSDMISLIATAQASNKSQNNGNPSKGYSNGKFNKVKSGDVIYIYLIGGITYPEIQCFRILGEKMKVTFILCTTEASSGQFMIKKCF